MDLTTVMPSDLSLIVSYSEGGEKKFEITVSSQDICDLTCDINCVIVFKQNQ